MIKMIIIKKIKYQTVWLTVFCLAGLGYLIAGSLVYAYVASSANYQIQGDSINFGGVMSSSATYKAEDTLGEWSIGQSSTTANILRAGYQALFFDAYLSISEATAVTLTPSLNGVGGGTPATGTVSWTVITNNPAGYALYAKAAATPALSSGSNYFSDYQPSYAYPDLSWSISNSDASFGFSPTGDDIVQKYKNNGVTCDAGSLITSGQCWNGFSQTNELIASADAPNYPSGAITTLNLQAEVGSDKIIPSGDYSATVVVTTVAL